MPMRPSGLRLMHFAAGGLALGFAVPFGLLFAAVRFDPRVRSTHQLEQAIGGDVLAVVPFYGTPRDRMRERVRVLVVVLLVGAALAAYAFAYWTRLAQTQ
jgi:hypothetical protein